METLVISTTMIEKILKSAPWIIEFALVPILVYAIYLIWKMTLGAIERWYVFRSKLLAERKSRLDLRYGRYIEDEIRKVFENIPLRGGGFGISGNINDSRIHVARIIDILKACTKYAKLEEYVINSTSKPVQEALNELIGELESGVSVEPRN